MKILFTSFAYAPETSGVPIVVQYLAEGLVKSGHCVSIATRKNGHNYCDKESINGVNVFRFEIGQDLFKRNIGDIITYINFVITYPKDVLIMECVQCHTTDILLPHLNEMNCKVVLHSHGGPGIRQKMFHWDTNIVHSIGNTHNWMRWKKYYGQTLPVASKYIDVAICLSLCASDLEYMNAHMKKVCILENAANDIFFDKVNYSTGTSPVFQLKSSEYILCIANYVPNKCQLDIVKAFGRMKNQDCALVLIGSSTNEYFKRVKKEVDRVVESTGKEIKMLCGVDRRYFPAIISQAKIFVMASEHEEYPVSLIEAMACGTPFVSTNAGCSRILPGGVTVVDRRDLPVFLNVVESDPFMLNQLGTQGQVYANSNNTIPQIISHLEEIIRSL